MARKGRDEQDQMSMFAGGSTSGASPSAAGVDPTEIHVQAAPSRGTPKKTKAKTEAKAKAVNGKDAGEKPRKKREPEARKRRTAVEMATKHREISVSEFFSKNRHLLGFDNPSKALLTTVKEGVDNSLDACEEAGILPEVRVEIHPEREDRFRVVIEDNGPGIVRKQVPKIFGSLLYGSKFHTLKQSRGQQGIGISAAGMYGLMTTGQPIRILSKTGKRKPAHVFELSMDTKRNQPQVFRDDEVEWDKGTGTRVEITLEGTYKKGRHSVDGYLKQVAIANPHARIIFLPPEQSTKNEEDAAEPQMEISTDGSAELEDGAILHERVATTLPPEPKEIQPHPHGVELGHLMKMMQETKSNQLSSFLQTDFSRVSARVAASIISTAGLKLRTRPSRLSTADAERLHKAMGEVKIMAPPTNCISPIGEDLLLKAIEQEVEADFHATVTRPPAVYRGNPFQVEVGLAYGGNLPGDELVTLYRFANRVPLQYQQGGCAITKSVLSVPWKNYQMSQSKGALPAGPMILVVHLASVWVPFTSESKEAVAHYPEIIKEIRLALMDAGRKLGTHIRRVRRAADEHKKRSYIQQYIPHIGIALQEILSLSDTEKDETVETLTDVLEKSRKM